MNNIELEGGYRLAPGPRSWDLQQQVKTKKGEVEHRTLGYFPFPENALNAYYRARQKDLGDGTLEGLVRVSKEVGEYLRSVLGKPLSDPQDVAAGR